MSPVVRIICVLLFTAFGPATWAMAEPAANDLRNWDVASGPRILDGQWQLIWKQPQRASSQVRLPYFWVDGTQLPWGEVGYGQVELHTRLLLPVGNEAPLSLRINDVKSAARVWVDGRLVVERGVVGDAQSEQAKLVSMLVPLPVGRLAVEVRIELSNHFHRLGGIEMPVLIGERAQLEIQQSRDRALYLLTLGGALFMSLFMVALGRSNVRDVGGVEFSLILLLAAMRIASTGELLDTILDWPALWVYRLEYIAGMLFPAAYLMFLYRFFPLEVNPFILRAVQAFGVFTTAITLLGPAALFSFLLLPASLVIFASSLYFLWVVLRAIRFRRQGAWLVLLGVLPVCVAVINDLLIYNISVLSLSLMPLAVLGAFLSHGLALGRRVLAALSHNIQLSAHLRGLNASLEARVEQRTDGLRKSRDLLDSTLAHVQTPLLSVDAQGQISAINEQFLSLFGIDQQAQTAAQLLNALAQGRVLLGPNECRALVPAANHRWRGPVVLHLGNRQIIELAGRSLREGGWVCTYVDVTAQHMAEQRIQGGGVCHWSMGVDSRRLQVTERCWQMLGYPVTPPLPTRTDAWLNPQDRAALQRAMRQALRDQGELYVDLRLLRQSGSWLWVSVRGRCILGPDRRPSFWVGAVEDIDRDWRSREALEHARDQAQREARQTAELFSILSHELRTPLVAIQGYLTLLEADAQDSRMRERLATVSNAATGLTDVLDGLAALARAEGARLPVYAPFDLRGLLRECIALVLPQAQSRGLSIELQLDARAPTMVVGSVMVLRQVVSNLLSNAIKFGDQGLISVTVDVRSDSVTLSIRDNGPGIAKDLQRNIFDAFVRLDRDRDIPGTGLGLYVVRRLVDLSEGRVSMDSQPGAGVRVTVELPWVASADRSAEALASPGRLDGMYILLVDDIEVNLDVTRELLMRWGARVGTASSGGSAVARCQHEEYDLVLMDMRMPDMDGLAASRAIRQTAPQGGPLIVALTANAAQLDHQACQEAGLDGVLPKPLQLAALLRILQGEDGFASARESSGLSPMRLVQLREWLGEDACDRLLPVLQRSLSEVRAKLTALITESEGAEIDMLVHRLRGSAMNFGLQSLAEKAAATHEMKDLPPLLGALDEHLLLIQAWIDEASPGQGQ